MFNIFIDKSFWQHAAVGLTAVLLLWAVYAGIQSGQRQAESRVVFQNASAAVQGLEYFYKDQDRYPSSVEFNNASLMLRYFDQFPLVEFREDTCNQSYLYKRPAQQNYSFSYCLSRPYEKGEQGWNEIVSQ